MKTSTVLPSNTMNDGRNSNKLVSATEVATLKRRNDGAKKTIKTCNKKIDLLKQKLEKKGLSLSEKRIYRSKIIAQETKRDRAEQVRRDTENECREIVKQNNRIHSAQLMSQRYEGRVLPKYDGYLGNWKQVLENKAKSDDNIRDLQLELVDIAGDDPRTEFNQKALMLLEKMEPKIAARLKYAKRLKPKFLNSLNEFFSERPAYLPEPRAIRFEQTLPDVDMEVENEDHQ